MTISFIKNMNEFDAALKESKLVLAFFFASWSGPDRFISPIIEEFAESKNYKSKIKFIKINIDETEDVAVKHKIKAMPTFILFKNGIENQIIMGSDQGKIQKMLDDALLPSS